MKRSSFLLRSLSAVAWLVTMGGAEGLGAVEQTLESTIPRVERMPNLPQPFAAISHWNPFFYLIDGFRYGFIGHAEGSLTIGVVLTAVLTVVMAAACWLVFRSGWRLKS